MTNSIALPPLQLKLIQLDDGGFIHNPNDNIIRAIGESYVKHFIGELPEPLDYDGGYGSVEGQMILKYQLGSLQAGTVIRTVWLDLLGELGSPMTLGVSPSGSEIDSEWFKLSF